LTKTDYIGLAVIAAILTIIAIGFSAYNNQVVEGDDTESDLGWCLRHFQNYCDKVDIEKLSNQLLERAKEWNEDHNNTGYCHDHFNNGTKFCHMDNASKIMPMALEEQQQTVNMTVYKKTLTFCYFNYDKDKETGHKKPHVECNSVGMPQKMLEKTRDFLENWTSGK